MTMPIFDVDESLRAAGDLAILLAELSIEKARRFSDLEAAYVRCGFTKSWRKATRLVWDRDMFDRKPIRKPIFRYVWP